VTALLIALVLGCEPALPEPWTATSANGRFVLEVKPESNDLDESATIALVDTATGKTRWRHDRAPYFNDKVAISDDGAWMAVFREWLCSECGLSLWNSKGKAGATLRVLDSLSSEERQLIGETDCGQPWLSSAAFDGALLRLKVRQDGFRPPIYEQGPTLELTVDLATGKVWKGGIRRASTRALVGEYRKKADPTMRLSTFHRIVLKAELPDAAKDEALLAFLRERARAPAQGEGVLAARWVARLGTDEDRRALVALPATPSGERDLGTLEGLEQSHSPLARPFALQALRERRAPEQLRSNALILLVRDGVAERLEAARLGMADPSARVREFAGSQVGHLAVTEEVFALQLELAGSEDLSLAASPRAALLSLLRSPDSPWRAPFLRALKDGKLDSFSGAFVVAGGVAEREGHPGEAAGHYRRALEARARERPEPCWADQTLVFEAKLRLAQMAAEAGETAESRRLAEEVLADKNSAVGHYVQAPGPNEYAGGPGARGHAASEVARKLLDSLR
jgi:hypothetical protein